MIVTDSAVKKLLINNAVSRRLVIHFPDGTVDDITSESIVSESMTLKRSINDSKELKFGGGIASQFKIKVFGIETDITDKIIEVSLIQTVRPLLYPSEDLLPSEDLFPCGDNVEYSYRLFTGKIDSALRQKNRSIKEIIAYDDFYSDSTYVYDFMTGFATYSPNATLRSLVSSIELKIDHDEDTEDVELFNDNTALSMTLAYTKNVIQSKKTTTTNILIAYAELNAAFAVMDNYNKLKYVQLLSPDVEEVAVYSDLEWEEFETANINYIEFPYSNKDDSNIETLHYAYGFASDTPSRYISDNLITKCCSNISTFVKAFSNNSNNYIFYDIYKYRPYKAVLFDYWWLEPGDKVIIHTGAEDTPTVTSYVFSVTISGIQNIKTTINANGEKYLGKDETA